MSPICKNNLSRSDYYINGQIADGIYVQKSSDRNKFPGPGQYSPSNNESQEIKSRTSLRRSISSPSIVRSNSLGRSISREMSASPRMAPTSAIVRNGILFSSREINLNATGPGYYSPQTSLLKKSYNVRVSDGNKKGVSSADKYYLQGPPGYSLHTPTSPKTNSRSSANETSKSRVPHPLASYTSDRMFSTPKNYLHS